MDASNVFNQHRAQHRLEAVNWAAFTLHAALALSAAISGFHRGNVRVPVFWPRSEWNNTKCTELGFSPDVQVCPSSHSAEHIGTGNFTLVLIASQTITCAFHCLQALQARDHSSLYIQWSLIRGIKVWHWVEYTFTAALLAHTILYFSGMLSLRTQLIGYAAQSTLMLVGLLQDILRHSAMQGVLDVLAAKRLIVFGFIVGFYNVSSVWAPSLYKLFIDTQDVDPPDFVKWVVLSEFLLYSSFGIAQLVFYIPFLLFTPDAYRSRFYEEEIVLCSLSFVSKAVLASAFSVCLVYKQCN